MRRPGVAFSWIGGHALTRFADPAIRATWSGPPNRSNATSPR